LQSSKVNGKLSINYFIEVMKNFSNDMAERFMNFVVKIMKFENQLCKTNSGRHIYGQLFRSGTSSGANYEEARSGESKADVIHKMQLVLKELRESHYWIKLIISAQLIPASEDNLKSLLLDSQELKNITAKAVVTAKSKIGSNISSLSLATSL
jgi:four helix bundle protein